MRRSFLAATLVVAVVGSLGGWTVVTAAGPALLPRVDVSLPDVTLTRSDGARVALRDVLTDRQPVVLNFVFTSCTTICPVMSATFSKFQAGLGPRRGDVKLVSISIDPEYDTPSRLAAYARTLKAGAGWDFFTGSEADIVAIQRAFGTYRGEKMSHEALTFLRAKDGQRWTRLDGLVSVGQLREAFSHVEGE